MLYGRILFFLGKEGQPKLASLYENTSDWLMGARVKAVGASLEQRLPDDSSGRLVTFCIPNDRRFVVGCSWGLMYPVRDGTRYN